MQDDRKPTTVRLRETLRTGLDLAAFVRQRSQSSIIEEAIERWLKQEGLLKSYQLTVKNNHLVLTEIIDNSMHILDVQVKNGVPVEEIATTYSNQLNAPVKIVEE